MLVIHSIGLNISHFFKIILKTRKILTKYHTFFLSAIEHILISMGAQGVPQPLIVERFLNIHFVL